MMKYRDIFSGLKALQAGMIILTADITLLMVLFFTGISYKVSPFPIHPVFNAIWKILICIAQLALLSGAILKIIGFFKVQKHNASYTAASGAYIVGLIGIIVSAYIGVTSNINGILAVWVFFVTETVISYTFSLIGAYKLFTDAEKGFFRQRKALYIILCIVFLFIMPIVVQAFLLHKVRGIKTSDDWITYEKKLTEQE